MVMMIRNALPILVVLTFLVSIEGIFLIPTASRGYNEKKI